ncbi:SDR family oxidoreductase [Mucilaginibacter sp. L196]|uniref:SDR family oxidoreductase n=1 Tax=Mucilaginibacter sp. L196 TaxID=1641870 RepID=UPI00131B9F93|nr:NAD(P)H-binding protein [Mucilaginibacter sp. L196]
MKIIVTGSLGHISKPLTEELVAKGHTVIVVSSNPDKQIDIEALGATAAIGTLADVDFLTVTFTGADAVYTMVPPNYAAADMMAYCKETGENFAEAVEKSGVKRVVHLSSIGAHMEKDSGLILAHRQVETILDKLSNVAITFMRPSGFYYNLLGFIPMIKNTGVITANYGADDMLIWVSPVDIAAAVADELEIPLTGHKVRYVASDELTGNETASILGIAIGKPDLKWILISDEERQRQLEAVGLKPTMAHGLVEMFSSQHNGALAEDFYCNWPKVMGKVKMADYAKEFAAIYNQK